MHARRGPTRRRGAAADGTNRRARMGVRYPGGEGAGDRVPRGRRTRGHEADAPTIGLRRAANTIPPRGRWPGSAATRSRASGPVASTPWRRARPRCSTVITSATRTSCQATWSASSTDRSSGPEPLPRPRLLPRRRADGRGPARPRGRFLDEYRDALDLPDAEPHTRQDVRAATGLRSRTGWRSGSPPIPTPGRPRRCTRARQASCGGVDLDSAAAIDELVPGAGRA